YKQQQFERVEDIIEWEHKNIESKISKAISGEGLSTNDRRDLFNDAKHEILHHMLAEEETYYKKISAMNEISMSQVRESTQEHHQIKVIMGELDNLAVENPDWTAKLQVLCEDLKHHHREEEEEFLAQTKEEWSDQESEEICQDFLKAKKKANF
ncbi:MAG: hemerythrin domain-containing protein, partial [Bacteriovoracaceae bacterium]|nr:hemerythrin domain-containing protein [Bacteriovoracaceae bacterium]